MTEFVTLTVNVLGEISSVLLSNKCRVYKSTTFVFKIRSSIILLFDTIMAY